MIQLQPILQRIYSDIRQNFKALFILLLYGIITQHFFHTVCPMVILTGMSCPACGLTRAAFLLFSGQFSSAMHMNPAICLWLPFLLYLCIFRYILGKKPPFSLPLCIMICLFTIGTYLWKTFYLVSSIL